MDQKSSKENQIIKTEQMEIGDNILQYEDSVIQLSNVAFFTIAPMPKTSYPAWIIIIFLVSFFAMFTGNSSLVAIGLMVMIICSIILYKIYDTNQTLGDYLTLHLTSGQQLFFSCYNKEFLIQVKNIIIECFKNKNMKYNINFQNCEIQNQNEVNHMTTITNAGNMALGNNNTISGNSSSTIQQSESTNTEADWNAISETFNNLLQNTNSNSPEYVLLCSAQYQIERKNSAGLKTVLANNIGTFKNNILCNMAATGAVELIKKLTGLVF